MAGDSAGNPIGRNSMSNSIGRNGRLNSNPNGRPASDKRQDANRDANRDTRSSELHSLSLEAALDELDTIVAALEESQRPLDESLALYERGVRLVQHSQELLDTADLRLQRLRPASEDDGFTDDFASRSGYALDDFELDDE
ncbi:MAG TPA: exodeoxyribonuclease VII small subunit [Ktedonobacterales bacterium]